MNQNPSLADVRARRADIAKSIEALRTEDTELAAAEGVLVRRFGAVQPSLVQALPLDAEAQAEAEVDAAAQGGEVPDEEDALVEQVRGLMKGNESIEELIVLLMDNCSDDWWTAAELQRYLTDLRDGRSVPMGTVSPTLTLLKRKGTVVRQGFRVGLATKFQTNEAAAE